MMQEKSMAEQLIVCGKPYRILRLLGHGKGGYSYGALLHMPIGENCFFRTADTGIHIWEITERGSYVIKANMDDHIRGI